MQFIIIFPDLAQRQQGKLEDWNIGHEDALETWIFVIVIEKANVPLKLAVGCTVLRAIPIAFCHLASLKHA